MAVESWAAAVDELERAVAAVVTASAPCDATLSASRAVDGRSEPFPDATELAEAMSDLADDDMAHLVERLQSLASRVSAVAAVVAGEWDRRRVWRSQGHRTAVSGLSAIASLSPSSARRVLRRGRALHAMPHTSRAVLLGRLSIDHLDLLGRADQPWRHHTFLQHEQMLADHCHELRWSDAVRMVDYWIQRVDASASAHDARLRLDAEHVWTSSTLDGHILVDAQLHPVGGEIVADELHRLARCEYLKDLRSGCTRTPGQRRAAALVEMARRSAACPDNASASTPLFTVHIGDDSMRHLCQLASGVVLHPSELVPHIDAAMMETILFDGPTTVVGVSSQRSFTGVLRRAIMARDKHCTHPSGCDEPAHRCDVDHIIPWTRGGPTRQHNGRLRCTTHNRDPELWPDDMFTNTVSAIGRRPTGDPSAGEPGDTGDPSVSSLAHRRITVDDIADVRRRWRTRHGLAPPDHHGAGDDGAGDHRADAA